MKYVSDDGKIYNSLEECKEADKQYAEKNKAALQLKEQRIADAKKVEEAFKVIATLEDEYNKKINEAIDAYYKERNNFIKKYGSYHMTFKSENPADIRLLFGDGRRINLNSMFDELIKLMYSIR